MLSGDDGRLAERGARGIKMSNFVLDFVLETGEQENGMNFFDWKRTEKSRNLSTSGFFGGDKRDRIPKGTRRCAPSPQPGVARQYSINPLIFTK